MSDGPPADAVQPAGRLPDPGSAASIDELTVRLRMLKVWAGDPSYEEIKERVNAAWQAAGRPTSEATSRTTVADCFRTGRRRLSADLVAAVVEALHPDAGYVAQWRQALRVIGGETEAASQVRVFDRLPPDLPGFTGRAAEVENLRHLLLSTRETGAVVAIEGMAGVGKTRLAIHPAHLADREKRFDLVLFVNLRGFHPDPAQPPADPLAVLDGFLRLLKVPGHRIPHDLPARAQAYRDQLVGVRALIVLDNAADVEQVRPLLPDNPACRTLITSRRNLAALPGVTPVRIDVFSSDEAVELLRRHAPTVPLGSDPDAETRIADRCGRLPLALELVAGHMAATPGWTLTDHAGRLDEYHDNRRLDNGIEVALSVSYQVLLPEHRRLLRMLALHPGQDFDVYAAAALVDADLTVAQGMLDVLGRDHLVQKADGCRYALHDLVRVFALNRVGDEDRPADRRECLGRMFDYYTATAATAMDAFSPAQAHRRPRIPPPGTPTPVIADADAARTWLDTERSTLIAIAEQAAGNGWPRHTVQLSTILNRYLALGPPADGLAVHQAAVDAAERTEDLSGQSHALNSLSLTYLQLGRYGQAREHLIRTLQLYPRVDDPGGHARTLGNLGVVEEHLGHYRSAAVRHTEGLALFRRLGDPGGQAYSLLNLGVIHDRLGRFDAAVEHLEQALAQLRDIGDPVGEATALADLGIVHQRAGRHVEAATCLDAAIELFQRAEYPVAVAWALDHRGALHARLGRADEATALHKRALEIYREANELPGIVSALNGLGEAALIRNDIDEATAMHRESVLTAGRTANRREEARAQRGLGAAYAAAGDRARARLHYRYALALYTDLGMPEAAEVDERLADVTRA
jgi:tetratricopeptide (TPR) repeat protein